MQGAAARLHLRLEKEVLEQYGTLRTQAIQARSRREARGPALRVFGNRSTREEPVGSCARARQTRILK